VLELSAMEKKTLTASLIKRLVRNAFYTTWLILDND